MTYYIYAIYDADQLPQDSVGKYGIEDYLAATLYVGKGKGDRLDQHVAEARRDLATGRSGEHAEGSKLQVLCSMLEAGNEPRAMKLAAPFGDDREAYAAEAFAIDAVNAVRRAHGRPALRNAVSGHGVTLEAESVYLDRLQVDDLAVRFDGPRKSILVKGSSEPLDDELSVVIDAPDVKARYGIDAGLPVDVMSYAGEGAERVGWNPHMPWNEADAAARARRFWPIAAAAVARWLAQPDTMPEYLFMGIPEAGRTVVRYAWRIDPAGRWELHPTPGGVRWGVPLVPGLVEDHPFLNRVLRDERTGKQVLAGYSSGIRIDGFEPLSS